MSFKRNLLFLIRFRPSVRNVHKADATHLYKCPRKLGTLVHYDDPRHINGSQFNVDARTMHLLITKDIYRKTMSHKELKICDACRRRR